ncbi:MAG TPA: hypothetical protein VLZ50_00690 [Terracidiphilus sp.]|nr:hypothetical protein [Terracidiphilus sp.]
MSRMWLVAASALLSVSAFAQAPGPWAQPAAALSEQVAGILGPGQANFAIRNLSTIPSDQIPAIQALLEQDLKAHGVRTSGAESANTIRVTLSENPRERLWVAEVTQGNETRVTMVQVDAGAPSAWTEAKSGLMLRREIVIETKQPIVTALEMGNALIAVEPEEIVIRSRSADGWQEAKRFRMARTRAPARDPRGESLVDATGNGFEAFVGGMECDGSVAAGAASAQVTCHESDDPWPIAQIDQTGGGSVAAFYNASRNYFTGVVTPAIGVDLPPFYSAAVFFRPAGAALLIDGIDGKVQLVDAGTVKNVIGTRDWGSDFAVLHSGCGAGAQVIASGSGEAVSDSLRAYELPASEAIPASAPLAMDGSVTALWSAPDGKSVYASVRHASGEYEVDRVTALCN